MSARPSIIVSNDPEAILRQEEERVGAELNDQILPILVAMIDGNITREEGESRLEELRDWVDREMEAIQENGAS